MADLTDELERLARLRKDGALSEAEFQAAKRQLLNRSTAAGTASLRREACEIDLETLKQPLFGEWTYRFVARAIGPTGRYNAGDSLEFTAKSQLGNDSSYRPAVAKFFLELLTDHLVRDGWDLVSSEGPSRSQWWRLKFQRYVTA